MKCGVGYSLFAVSARSANTDRTWARLSAVRTFFHSGASKAAAESVQWWFVLLSSQQVELLHAMVILLRYLLCSQGMSLFHWSNLILT